jgi:predicted DNA-binding ribbon-helix-helix protein
VIGISPHQDFMETIANSKKITARELFDKINESVQQDTNSKNTNKDN